MRFLKLTEAARRAVASVPDAHIGIAPHSLRAVTAGSLAEVVGACREGPIHIHAAEQVKEVRDCIEWSGQRPVAWLLDHLDVDPRWVLIHATHMTEAETKAVAASGAVVGLCPLTEASLGDGIFAAPRLLKAGGRFGIGTDSNIEITAPGELKQLEYSQRLKHRRRNVLPQTEGQSSGRALYDAALAGGAQASGRAVSSLSVGCRADIVVLDASQPDLAAVRDDRWLDAYVFVAGSKAVRSVWSGGRQVVADGSHASRTTIAQRYRRTMSRLAAL